MVSAKQGKKSSADCRRCDSSPASLASNLTPTENSMTAENDSLNSICIDGLRAVAGKSCGDLHHAHQGSPASSPENALLTGRCSRSSSLPENRVTVIHQPGDSASESDEDGGDLLAPLHEGPMSPKAVGKPAVQDSTDATKTESTLRLPSEWTIWFDKSAPGEDDAPKRADSQDKPSSSVYDGCIVELASFDSVRGFWEYWNTLRVENLKAHCNLRIFRKGIKPLQEDAINASGGKWVVRGVPISNRKTMWTDMALVLISEKIQEYTSNVVCGAVLSTRETGDSLQIWVDGNRGTAAEGPAVRPHISVALKRMFFPHSREAYSMFIYQTHRELHSHRKSEDERDSLSSFDEISPASPTERSRKQVRDDGTCIRGSMAYPTGPMPNRPRSESAGAVEGFVSSFGLKTAVTPATRELMSKYPAMKPLSLDFTAEVPSSAHSTPHKIGNGLATMGACAPAPQGLISKQKHLQTLLSVTAPAAPPPPPPAQSSCSRPSPVNSSNINSNLNAQNVPLPAFGQQQPQQLPLSQFINQAQAPPMNVNVIMSSQNTPNQVPQQQQQQQRGPVAGYQQSSAMPAGAPQCGYQMQYQQQQQWPLWQQQQQQLQQQQQQQQLQQQQLQQQQLQQQQQRQQPPQQQPQVGVTPPYGPLTIPMHASSWQSPLVSANQTVPAMSPALQADLLKHMSRPLSREVSGVTTDTTPSYSHSDGDADSTCADEDLPDDLRAIQDRAKSIRTLKKKIRYISFFLQRQCKGRELTASETQRINSLPLLQQELKMLETQQEGEVTFQQQANGVDCDTFLKKPQQSMTFTSESEKRFKTMRALRKKIRFIHYHVERQEQGKSLSPAEHAKVLSLPELESTLAQLEADEAVWQQQNGGRRWNKHKAAAAAAEKTESSSTEQPVDSAPAQPSSYTPSAPTVGAPSLPPPHAAIENLHNQISAQKRQLEEKQRRIENLMKTRQVGSPVKMSPNHGFPPAANQSNFIPSYYLSPGGQSCGVGSPNAGPPPLGSPMMSPPMSPNYTLGRY